MARLLPKAHALFFLRILFFCSPRNSDDGFVIPLYLFSVIFFLNIVIRIFSLFMSLLQALF